MFLLVYLLTAPYQAPHLVHKMLVLKDVALFANFRIMFSHTQFHFPTPISHIFFYFQKMNSQSLHDEQKRA